MNVLRTGSVLCVAALALTACTKPSSIEGKVVDGFGTPVRDATVKVEGTQFMSQTDDKGQYSVRYVPGDITIGISKTGYTDASFSVKIATESIFPAESKTIYQIPNERGIWYMDFDTKQYVAVMTISVKADETMQYGAMGHRYWHKSYVVQLSENNHTHLRVADDAPDLVFVDNDGVDQKLIQLENIAERSWSILDKSWSDGVMVEDASRVTILRERYSSGGNGLTLRSVNVAPGHAYAFANYSGWGGGDIEGAVYLFTVGKK